MDAQVATGIFFSFFFWAGATEPLLAPLPFQYDDKIWYSVQYDAPKSTRRNPKKQKMRRLLSSDARHHLTLAAPCASTPPLWG